MRTLLAVCFLLAVPVAAPAQDAPLPVSVERHKPKPPKEPTFQFLKDNRVFFRARLDALRTQLLHDDSGRAWDERHQRLAAILEEIEAAEDSLRTVSARWQDAEVLDSVEGLLVLERELAALEQQLAAHESRLWELQNDFTGRQETAVVVLLRGYPETDLEGIRLTDAFGDTTVVRFQPGDVLGLQSGGMAEIRYAYVEPREQVWEIELLGPGWQVDGHGDLTLAPVRSRVGFLELDLAGLRPETGAPGLNASFWTVGIPQRDPQPGATTR